MLREMIKTFAEPLMSAEADGLCGAGDGQCRPDRGDQAKRLLDSGLRRPGGDGRVGDSKAASGSHLSEWL